MTGRMFGGERGREAPGGGEERARKEEGEGDAEGGAK